MGYILISVCNGTWIENNLTDRLVHPDEGKNLEGIHKPFSIMWHHFPFLLDLARANKVLHNPHYFHKDYFAAMVVSMDDKFVSPLVDELC